MVTACLLIMAWTAGLPVWASATITALTGIRFVCKCVSAGIQIAEKVD